MAIMAHTGSWHLIHNTFFMQCLYNRIGITGCGAPASDAVVEVIANPDAIPPVVGVEAVPALPILLINQLPGVTLEKINCDEKQRPGDIPAAVE